MVISGREVAGRTPGSVSLVGGAEARMGSANASPGGAPRAPKNNTGVHSSKTKNNMYINIDYLLYIYPYRYIDTPYIQYSPIAFWPRRNDR